MNCILLVFRSRISITFCPPSELQILEEFEITLAELGWKDSMEKTWPRPELLGEPNYLYPDSY